MLLAEDNAVNQRLAVRLLEKQAHTVVVAGTGREALDLLERQRFDVVLMDVQMPEMGGFEATARIRAAEARGRSYCTRGGRLPVIALTAHAMTGDRERCLAAGMDGYVPKPIQPEVLWQAVHDALRPAPPTPAEARPAVPAEVFNPEALLRRLEGDTELLRELVGLFLDDCPRLVAELREALAQQDQARVKSVAHALKGSVANFSAVAAQDAARRLETFARDGDLEGAERAFAELEKALDQLRVALAVLAPEPACP